MSSSDLSRSQGQRNFATTQWNIVRNVADSDIEQSRSALQQLCKMYWYPLYSFVRHQGMDASTSADLTQAFFADLLERQDLKRVDSAKGKFRSFLLAAMKHFMQNQWKKAKALKRGGNRQFISLNANVADSRYRGESAAIVAGREKTPEQIFQLQWARTLLDNVQRKIAQEYTERGKSHVFEKLSLFLAGRTSEISMSAVAEQLSMTDVAVKVAVHRMRQRFGQLIRESIADTVDDPSEIDSEIQQLFESLKA